MGESLTQQRRVSEEGLRVVKLCQKERMGRMTSGFGGTFKEALANSVPAAAVIQRVQALFGIIGRKARVGCSISLA